MSKAPDFEKAIFRHFKDLKLDEQGGQWRICRFSGEKFYVRPEDVVFYKKISVPLPTLSPKERLRRRMSFSPGYNLSKVKSFSTGKQIIAAYPPDTPLKIQEHGAWFFDDAEPMKYGLEGNPFRPFFEQFRELQLVVPRPNLNSDSSNVNSDYTNNSVRLKNCYLAFDSLDSENIYYGGAIDSKDCIDCLVFNSETGYMLTNCYRTWRCFFCDDVYDTLDSYFLYDCRNCQNCFMCSNLRHKKYYFFNQPLSKEEYEKKIKEINLGNYEVFQKYFTEFQKLKNNAIHRENRNEKAINSIGDWIADCRNCYHVSFAMNSDNVAYSLWFLGYRDSYDISQGTGGELCYELLSISTENNYAVKFSNIINHSRNMEYCELCYNCHDCFGCVSLKNKSFCIFNKQYSEEEYWKMVDKIKTEMLRRGEYGEFFPPEVSPLPYNFSINAAYPEYSDFETAKKYGYYFREAKENLQDTADLETVSANDLPLDIKEVGDEFLGKVIYDEENDKKFRLTRYELNFYRKYNIPLPRINPFARMYRQLRDNYKMQLALYERNCDKCQKAIHTSYDPEGPEKNIYCEECYKKEVA